MQKRLLMLNATVFFNKSFGSFIFSGFASESVADLRYLMQLFATLSAKQSFFAIYCIME